MVAKEKKPNAAQQVDVMKSLNQTAAAWAVGLDTRTLRNKICPANPDGSYDVSKVFLWANNLPSQQRQQSLVDSDGEISDAARKFRSEANILEMKEQAMAGTLVRAADIQQNLDRLADAIRTLGEDFGRSPMPIAGSDIQQKMNEMIDNLEWRVE